ncbi:MAG: hypothetical protein HY013_04635 [Candidatus Solibacter usitatus]|nr:hypothetical protein [Candidatus Solibacter usitatus]
MRIPADYGGQQMIPMKVPNLFLCLYLLILAAAFAGTPPEQASTGSGAGPGVAADTGTGSQTDEDPELKKLKAASALADERLKLYNKRKELAAAQVPTIPAGNAGALTLTGDPVEGVGMAYEVLGSLTAKMAGLVRCGDENTRIIVFSATEIAGIETYHAWQAQVQLLIQGLKDAIAKDKVVVKAGFAPSTIGPGIAAIGPGITALVNLISLFRQDVEIKVTDITPDEKALVALLAGKLRDRKPECKAKVYYPAALPVGLLKTTREIDKFLADIETQREEVAALNLKRIGEKPAAEKEAADKKNEAEEFDKTMKELAARRKALEDKKAQAAKEPDPKKKEEFRKANEAEEKQLAAEEAKYTKAEFIKLYNAAVSAQEYLDRLTQLLALFDTALRAVDAFRTSLLRMDEPSGLAQITKLQRAAALETLLSMGKKDAYAVQATIQKLAANTRTKKSFFLGARLAFSGGGVASFLQYRLQAGDDAAGEVVASGVFDGYTGYRGQGGKGKPAGSGNP